MHMNSTVMPQESGDYTSLSLFTPTPSISSSAGDLITGYPLDIRYRNLFDKNQVLALFVSIGIVCLSKE